LQRVDWEPGGDTAKINAQNRGISKFKRISWDEATDIIASEVNRIVEKYGPSGITSKNSPHGEKGMIHKDHGVNENFLNYYMMAKYGESWTVGLSSPGSWEGSVWGSKHVWGYEIYGQETGTTMKDICENTELLLCWASDGGTKNWISSSGQIGDFTHRYMRELGIKHVYIQPDVNSEAANHCDKWIPVLPTTDAALQLAIAYTWIKEETYNQEYLDTHAIGFDAGHIPAGADSKENFKDYVLGTYDGVEKSPAWASPLCGVPEWTIKALAREFASKTTSICHKMDGGGLKRSPYCHENARLEVYLLAMQGWGRPGVHQLKGVSVPSAAKPAAFSKNSWPFGDGNADRPLKEKYGVSYDRNDAARPGFAMRQWLDCIENPPVYWYVGEGSTLNQFIKRKYPMDGKSEVHMYGVTEWDITSLLVLQHRCVQGI
jgi:trimethylamine-N-oxide reductase (cytochrome c)